MTTQIDAIRLASIVSSLPELIRFGLYRLFVGGRVSRQYFNLPQTLIHMGICIPYNFPFPYSPKVR